MDPDKEAARRFIKERGPAIHPSLGVTSRFNEEKEEFETPEWQSEGAAHLPLGYDDELDVVADEEDTRGQCDPLKECLAIVLPSDLDFVLIPGQCGWEDVIAEWVRVTDKAAISQSHDGIRGWIRKSGRRLFEFTDILSTGINAIPDELCILHAALAVVYSIARHRRDNRELILGAFKNLPSVIQKAAEKVECFGAESGHPRDPRLRLMRAVTGLQRTLLRVLPKLLDHLNPPKRHGYKFAGGFNGPEVKNLLEAVRSSVQAVDDAAESVTDRTMAELLELQRGNYHTTQAVWEITKGTGDDVEELRKEVGQVLQGQRSLQAHLEAVSGQNAVFQLLLENLKPHAYFPDGSVADSDGYQTTLCGTDAAVTAMTPGMLLAALDCRHLRALDDEGYVLRQHRVMNSEALAHASGMIKAPQVSQLLKERRPGVVLVEGHLDTTQQNSRVTPISQVCATLAQALRKTGNSVLVFFCGRNLDGDDPQLGPSRLIRSLLAQLVLLLLQNRWMEDGAVIMRPSYLQGKDVDLDQLSTEDVCQLFHSLLRAVPANMSLVCIVDGISLYEKEVWQGDYDMVMRAFRLVTEDSSLAAPLKLVMTSATSSRFLSSIPRVSLRNQRGGRAFRPGGNITRTAFAAASGWHRPSSPPEEQALNRRETSSW